MKMSLKRVLSILCCAALLVTLLGACGNEPAAPETPAAPSSPSSPAAPSAPEEPAAKWPTDDITFYVPGPAGSPIDVAARVVTDHLESYTGVTVNVENDDAGNGEFLMQKLHAADPDGQTLMVCGIGSILNYYTGFHEFNLANPEHYTIVCSSLSEYIGTMVYAQKSLPFDDLEGMVEYAKANPGTLRCTMSSGTTGEIILTQMYTELGIIDDIKIVEASVPEIVTGLLGGTIDVGIWYENLLFEENLKPIVSDRLDRNYDATVDEATAKILDTVPIFGEIGMEKFHYEVPMAIVAAPGTSDEICKLINEAMDAINSNEEALPRIAAIMGNAYKPFTTEETRDIFFEAHDIIAGIYG